MTAPSLDHIGVVTQDLGALATTYERLGFTLTPRARHADGRIGNHCAMLCHGYIELLAVVEPKARSVTLERFLARYAGVHILAFAVDDIGAAMARLCRTGISTTVTEFQRGTDDTNPGAPQARFAVIQVADQPEGRINLVHHLTPEALWQGRFLHHRNNAHELTEVALSVADPADTAARYSRAIGCVIVPDPIGGLALELAHGRVRLSPADGAVVPRVVSATVRTSDENAAIERLVAQRRIAHSVDDSGLVIDSNAAGGVVLRFAPGLGSAPP